MKCTLLIFVAMVAVGLSDLHAQAKIDFLPDDTFSSVLHRNIGQSVELRLKSGEKIGGRLEKIGDKLVYLTQLTGAEYYEAVIEIADLSAVVVRAKK